MSYPGVSVSPAASLAAMIAFSSARLSPLTRSICQGWILPPLAARAAVDDDIAQQRRIDRLVEKPAHRPARRDGVGNVHAATLAEPRGAGKPSLRAEQPVSSERIKPERIFMPITMFSFVGLYDRTLGSLAHLLDKGADFATDAGTRPRGDPRLAAGRRHASVALSGRSRDQLLASMDRARRRAARARAA